MFLVFVIVLLCINVNGSICKVISLFEKLKLILTFQMCDKEYEFEEIKHLGQPTFVYNPRRELNIDI